MEMNRMVVSKTLKNRVILAPSGQPIMTIRGVTRRAIWMDEPTATPMARSILSFMATVTAVTCSAALPTMGNKIKPTKVSEMPLPSTMPSILSTRNSAHRATKTVDTTSLRKLEDRQRQVYNPAAHQGVIVAISMAASVSSAAISSYR
jgi:hypothetical protein